MHVLLTPKQYEIANLIYENGLSVIDVAKELRITKRTVESHIVSIYSKLGVGNVRQFFVWMRSNSIAPSNAFLAARDERREKCRKLKANGVSISTICERTGLTIKTIYTYCKDE